LHFRNQPGILPRKIAPNDSSTAEVAPMPGIVITIIIIAVLVVLVLFVVGVYNRLQRLNIRANAAWSDIDVQLKRRHDLVPNLVETVKGYAAHERNTLEAVIAARQQAVSARGGGIQELAGAENMLTQALGRLFALSEAYPTLKADANFRALQEELTSTENKIGFARQHYNRSAGQYNESLAVFPNNVVAGMFSFEKKPFFEIEDHTQREVPKVAF
jgi:LemA protein